ncbi:L,D-transpeptidase family protein [Caenimonas sp. SL110]|uniref:L,D-transpeptidase family protein n=1 Tax=Caenimonas sp. SL110 TaxID=1450524 RepID=UPI000654300A|nr:L,D-transpeptidase family protein [Caenimonas sp. SL110]
MKNTLRALLGMGVLAAAAIASGPSMAQASPSAAELARIYAASVDRRIEVPAVEVKRYAALADSALFRAEVTPAQPQYIVVVDRSAWVQAVLLLWRAGEGDYSLVGASPVSTGLAGSFDHFETPLGVFAHDLRNPDFRSEGTLNTNGIRGYGAKGMRVFDLGWQPAPKGWGDGKVMDMRLQMHATDPDLLERRLGTAQSKGCIRIPATLNHLLDHHGVLDAAYEEAARTGQANWVLPPDREPVAGAGRYVIVVDSLRNDRPEWSPAPYIPHVRPPARPALPVAPAR